MVFKSAKKTNAVENQNGDFHHHAFNAIFFLPNNTLILKALDQLQSAGEEILLTHDIT